jgi:triacylglycerol lipase
MVATAWRIVNSEDIVTTVPLATTQLLVEGFGSLTLALLLKSISTLNYEHVGMPVTFTTHTGSIEGNHGMLQYLDAVKEGQLKVSAVTAG